VDPGWPAGLLALMTMVPVTREDKEVLRALRDGKRAVLSAKEHLRLVRMSMIRGTMEAPVLTVVGRETADEPDKKGRRRPWRK
jgi:hypothetical protein